MTTNIFRFLANFFKKLAYSARAVATLDAMVTAMVVIGGW